ncbi:MAG: hypothetical protein VKK59_03355 [Vampirovibrionales bacterium]|nr:hypothetical protein [Vampirovibrionales bacterium]
MSTNSVYTGYNPPVFLPPQSLPSNPLSISYGNFAQIPGQANPRFVAQATHTIPTQVQYPLYFNGNAGPTPQSTLNQIGAQFMPANPFAGTGPMASLPSFGGLPMGGASSSMDNLFQQYLQERCGGQAQPMFANMSLPAFSPQVACFPPVASQPAAPLIGNAQQVVVLVNPVFTNNQPRFPIGGGSGFPIGGGSGFPIRGSGFPIGGSGFPIGGGSGFPIRGGGFPIGGGSGFPIGGGSGFPIGGGSGFPIGGGSGFPIGGGSGFPIGGGSGFPIRGGGFPYIQPPVDEDCKPIAPGYGHYNQWDQNGSYRYNYTVGTQQNDTLKQRGVYNFNQATLRDGNDTVTQSGQFNRHDVMTGKGDDTVTSEGQFNASFIRTGEGKDTVTLAGRSNRHEVATGKGEDVVTIEGNRNTAIINTGLDKDTVSVAGNCNGVAINTDDGDDTISVTGERANGWIQGGNGNDTITLEGSAKKNNLSLLGGDGRDQVVILGSESDWDKTDTDDSLWTICKHKSNGSEYKIGVDIEEIKFQTPPAPTTTTTA